eukprot:Sspe_Gene.3777::Locus_1255_Transcript_1_1_Confidence_1.000_Length_755::g.3777::m.3777
MVSEKAVVLRGDVATGADDTVEMHVTEGAAKGKTVRALFQAEGDGAETTFGEFAMGVAGGPAPTSVNAAMGTAGQTVLVMAKCLSQACAFEMELRVRWALLRRGSSSS